jgi:hypothetical protein
MSSSRRLSAIPLRLVASTPRPRRLTASPQMSPANAFEGRGRYPEAARWREGRLSPRSVTFASVPDRDAFMQAWSRFIRATTRDRDHCAKVYATTFQTACNWWDGARVPTGDKVAHAFALHPNQAAQLLAGV